MAKAVWTGEVNVKRMQCASNVSEVVNEPDTLQMNIMQTNTVRGGMNALDDRTRCDLPQIRISMAKHRHHNGNELKWWAMSIINAVKRNRKKSYAHKRHHMCESSTRARDENK